MKKIVLIFTAIVIANVANSCGKSIDARQNLINASNLYLEDKKLDKELADKAAEVAVESGKYCVTPKPEIPCPTCQNEVSTQKTDETENETEKEKNLKSHEVSSSAPSSTTNNYITNNNYYGNSKLNSKSKKTKVVGGDREEEATYAPAPTPPTKVEVKKDCCSTTINGRLYKVVTYNVSEEQKAIIRNDEKGEYNQFIFQNGKWWTQVPN